MTTRCTECGLPIVIVDGHRSHPSCDPTDPAAARIRAQHDAYTAGVEGMALAAVNHPDDKAAGLSMVRLTALSLRFFNADDVRDKFPQWDELNPHVRGSVFTTAAKASYDYITGTSEYKKSRHPATKGHPIQTWKSEIYVDEFAVGLTPGVGAA